MITAERTGETIAETPIERLEKRIGALSHECKVLSSELQHQMQGNRLLKDVIVMQAVELMNLKEKTEDIDDQD